jgi:hypothetical protein
MENNISATERASLGQALPVPEHSFALRNGL